MSETTKGAAGQTPGRRTLAQDSATRRQAIRAERDALRAENARLREALRGVQDAYQHHFDEMPAAWQTQDSMIADLLRELGEGD